jgi:predicted ATPase
LLSFTSLIIRPSIFFNRSGLLPVAGYRQNTHLLALKALARVATWLPHFEHEKNTARWGWSRDYIQVLRAKLERDKSGKIPAFWLAVWLFREREWKENAEAQDVINLFLREFEITPPEARELFLTSGPDIPPPIFTEEVYSDAQLLQHIEPAPDSKPEEGGTLKMLELQGIGPLRKLLFEPGERLSIITGDNGLGKTFLLECAWWSLTGHWAEQEAYPRLDAKRSEPVITFEISGKRNVEQRTSIKFDWDAQSWPAPKGRPTIPGLIVYARVDGSFAIWDPVRHSGASQQARPSLLLFSRDDVLRGFEGQIEGLLRDWVTWQRNPDQTVFETFKQVLRRLSPPDMGALTPGEPVRLALLPREIPTPIHHFGQVPFIYESAGIRRIVTIAYLLVWAWNEHRIYSALAKKAPQDKIVILVDEMEAHLHPKWQRVVLPAILDVTSILSRSMQPQIIVATHSPMILASLESSFSDRTDKLFHLQLTAQHEVRFRDIEFVRYGRIDEWLTSNLFELVQPRSREGERAIEQAKQLLAQRQPSSDSIRDVSEALKRTLAQDDEFWPRWLYFAEKKGVKI